MTLKKTLEEKREALAKRDMEILDGESLFHIFLHGCTGYNNMSDEEVEELYLMFFSE